jgi:hypothetical protein
MANKPFDADSAEPMRRFARPIREGSREPDPMLCRHLRARNVYVPESSRERDAPRSAPSAQYWCAKTMRPDGPDRAPALPEDCTDERICFDASVGPETES